MERKQEKGFKQGRAGALWRAFRPPLEGRGKGRGGKDSSIFHISPRKQLDGERCGPVKRRVASRRGMKGELFSNASRGEQKNCSMSTNILSYKFVRGREKSQEGERGERSILFDCR